MDQWQGRFSLGQVIADVFPHAGRLAVIVENIVGYLERAPQPVSEVGKGCFRFLGLPRDDSAETAGCFEQLGRFVFDHLQVRGFIDFRVAHVEQLLNFALRDGVRRVRKNFHHMHGFHTHHHLEAAAVEKITDQDTRGIAPDCMGRFLAAAGIGFIHHVVMQQGGGVNELDDRCQVDMFFARVAAGMGTDHQQHRAQSFSAAGDDVMGNLVDQHDIGSQGLADTLIHSRHIRG